MVKTNEFERVLNEAKAAWANYDAAVARHGADSLRARGAEATARCWDNIVTDVLNERLVTRVVPI
ncbi:MAG: hypothetical protein ACO33F_08015 [Ilumatobacteraceae bacterium]|jgi:hypothetical protein